MDISKIFKSKTRKELFRLYFTNPDREHYLRELERILDIPVSMVRKELIHLEEQGVFRSRKKGNLTYYLLNHSYPLFDELKGIVFKTIGVQGLLREVLSKIRGIEVAFIYGSFAKHDETAKSDIDLLIVGTFDDSRLLREVNKLEKVLKREINYSIFRRDELKKKLDEKDPFVIDLRQHPKIFVVGGENDLWEIFEESLAKGLLRRQTADLRGVEKLISRAHKDLKTAKANLDIDEGISYTVAYLGMLHAARAFILLKGFRPADGYQHKTVVEFMSHFLGREFKVIVEQFDRMRRKRNFFTYEIDISISKSEASNALDKAKRFVDLIKEIIQKENPQMEFKF